MKSDITRRDMMRLSAAGIVGTVLPKELSRKPQQVSKPKIKEFRTLGRTGIRVSDVGLGAGVPQDASLVNYVLNMGVNYIDTAERYSGGQSEKSIGLAIKGRPRKDIYITTKLAVNQNDTTRSLIDRFNGCLERLQTDYADILMMHNPVDAEALKHSGFHSAVSQLKADGKLRFSGASTHNPNAPLVCGSAIDDGRFDALLMVYNFMQEKMTDILAFANEKNVGVTIMKVHASEHPEQLGQLSREVVKKLQDEADQGTLDFQKKHDLTEKAYFSAAMRWVLQNKNVATCAMSIRNTDMADDYVANSGKPFKSSQKETLRIYSGLKNDTYCRHACGECESTCPYGVAVNDVLRMDTYFTNYRQEKMALTEYARLTDRRKPLYCETCSGGCESKCPFGLSVRNRLIAAHERLTLTTDNTI
ncbi:aldo/keto reductase [candidate division KSB1 bacterium]